MNEDDELPSLHRDSFEEVKSLAKQLIEVCTDDNKLEWYSLKVLIQCSTIPQ